MTNEDVRDMEIREGIYHALRDYQDGKMTGSCVLAGRLDAPLTTLFDRLVSIVKGPRD